MKVAVVGGGVFGSLAALKLAEAGKPVTLFERRPGLLQGTSLNANRLHLGFHYPRDDNTAHQCRRGYRAFQDAFGDAILPGVQNDYFIASSGSLTSPENYLSFCDRLGLAHEFIDLRAYAPAIRNVALGIRTQEAMFSIDILRGLLSARLRDQGVSVHCGHEISDIGATGGGFEILVAGQEKVRFDAVVNCSYADINRLAARLGHRIQPRQYEYVAVPIIEVDLPCPASVTIMDGSFMSFLPYGSSGRHLLYHVDHSVVARSDSELLDCSWLEAETSPFASIDRQLWFDRHLSDCREFLPCLAGARLAGVAQGPRMVLAEQEASDARPSFVTLHQTGYVSVFAGKIDHSMWLADEVVRLLD